MTVLRQLKRDLEHAANTGRHAGAGDRRDRRSARPVRSPGLLVMSLAVTIAIVAVILVTVLPGRGMNTGRPFHEPRLRHTTSFPGFQSCRVSLSNTSNTGELSPPVSQISQFEITALDRGVTRWPTAHKLETFHTCPTPRALLIGDQLALSIGLPYLANEQDYGIAIADAPELGCAFDVTGEINVNGTWQHFPAACAQELTRWAAEARAFHVNEIIVELGLRDEFDRRKNGTIVHLGQTAYDHAVETRISTLIDVLGEHGKRKILFLSVPNIAPRDEPNGQLAPESSSSRHNEINNLITVAANRDSSASGGPNAEVLDIDDWLSHNNDKYSTDLNGHLCRFDGIDVTEYCSHLTEPDVLRAARNLLNR